MKFRSRRCPACGSRDDTNVRLRASFEETQLDEFSFSARKPPEFMHFRMVCCPECDLLYASPAPEHEWFCNGYESAGFEADVEARYAAGTYATRLPEIVARLPDTRRALDVGAGTGAFLERLIQAGFSEVWGIEPSAAAVARAKPDIRRRIKTGFFASGSYEAGSMSLVTSFQTLEHLEDPADFCAEAHRLLKPGGCFYAVTHNYRALASRVLGRRSPIYDIEHLQLMSPRSLEFLLQKAGFEHFAIRPLWNRYPAAYWLKLLPVRKKSTLRWWLGVLGLTERVVPLRAGNLMAIAYKQAE